MPPVQWQDTGGLLSGIFQYLAGPGQPGVTLQPFTQQTGPAQTQSAGTQSGLVMGSGGGTEDGGGAALPAPPDIGSIIGDIIGGIGGGGEPTPTPTPQPPPRQVGPPQPPPLVRINPVTGRPIVGPISRF